MDESKRYLLEKGTILAGRYRIEWPLGEGGFGVTYCGTDLRIGLHVAIKEFFPYGYVVRDTNVSNNVSAKPDDKSRRTFESYKAKFLDEAHKLKQCEHIESVVNVREYFEENSTAYIVMEYLRGETLKHALETRGVMDADWLCRRMLPLMYDLHRIHELGFLHRDISPDNIMLQEKDVFRLMDFGAARDFDIDEKRSMTVMLKHGFAPYEQYTRHGNQGPWTDVYALSATIYNCITNKVPDTATDRLDDDTLKLPSELGAVVSPQVEQVIIKGLCVLDEGRWHSMPEMIRALEDALNTSSGQIVRGPEPDTKQEPEAPKQPEKPIEIDEPVKNRRKPGKSFFAGLLFALTAVILIAVVIFGRRPVKIDRVEPTAAPYQEVTAEPTVAPTAKPTQEPVVTPSPEPTATPSPEPTVTPSPEPTATPSPEPTATPSPEPTATPSPEPTAMPSPEPTATPSPEPTATPSPEPTATPSPEPTATPTPAMTAVPASTIAPVRSAQSISMMPTSYSAIAIGSFREGRVMFLSGGKWGFMDDQGQLIGEGPVWDGAGDFHEGLAAVSKNAKWGFIDRGGSICIDTVYEDVGDFSEGMAAAKTKDRYGYIDAEGRMAIGAQYDAAGSFSEGLAPVMLDGKWGFIDRTGNMVIEPQWVGAYSFCDGRAAVVCDDGKWGFIDHNAQLVIEAVYDECADFSQGRACVAIEAIPGISWQMGFIDTDGQKTSSMKWMDAGYFSEGLAAVRQTRKMGYINAQGEVVIGMEWDDAGAFSQGAAVVSRDEMSGMINTQGELVVEMQWDALTPFDGGCAAGLRDNNTIWLLKLE